MNIDRKKEIKQELSAVLKNIVVTGFDLENFFETFYDGLTQFVPTGKVQIVISGYYKPAKKKIKKKQLRKHGVVGTKPLRRKKP